MMKGIYFDDTHSYTDLNLVLSSINIPPATAKTTYVDIPGSDGSVDLTEAQGEVKFKNRECSFTFTVFPYDDFEKKKKHISNLLNGKRCRIILDKDPEYYWDGRCSINTYASNKNIHRITVNATVKPYKYKLNETVVIVPATGEKDVSIVLTNGRKTVCPTIICTKEANFKVGNLEFNLGAGTHKVIDFQLYEGNTTMTVRSSGETTIKYQEGDL